MGYDKAKVTIDLEEYNELLKSKESNSEELINLNKFTVKIVDSHMGKMIFIVDIENHKDMILNEKTGKLTIIDSKKEYGTYQSTPFITVNRF